MPVPLKVPLYVASFIQMYLYSCKVNIDIQKHRAKCIVSSEFFLNIKLSAARGDHTLFQVAAHKRFTN